MLSILFLPVLSVFGWSVIIIIATIGGWSLIPSKAKKIAILGTKGAGKSTLFFKLGGYPIKPAESTKVKEIEEFKMKKPNGDTITIAATKDFGGEDIYVRQYQEVIEKGTFIHFLINAKDDLYNKKGELNNRPIEITSRLRKIKQVVKNKEIKKNDVGVNIIVTHLDEIAKSFGKTKEDVALDLNKVFKKQYDIKNILIGNLNEDNFINEIKNRITG